VPPDKTARVFARLNAPPVAASPAAQVPDSEAALLAFMRAEGNDLLAPATAVVPEIADVMAALQAAPGCRFAGLSGAGPTAFGIFSGPGEASAAAAALAQARPGWWVAAVTLGP
jgi:4-diphosphocytidyl-2-C-methyl-D-erythritol kinase